ncbi:MAG TPA: hypothetical protein DC049_17585 [Spirochaetia bacterium]|nr:hypothetical protein [Spirochaetia bacterium]
MYNTCYTMNQNNSTFYSSHLETNEIIKQYNSIQYEADLVRKNDQNIIKGLFRNFYQKTLSVGIGFNRAFGSILSGDYFELFPLPDSNYLFIFADISGHGLPAYTNLIRLRNAVILSIKEAEAEFKKDRTFSIEKVIKNAGTKFTDLMEFSNSDDFASAVFTYITNDNDKFTLRFFNRGTFFPIIVRKFRDDVVDIYNLNYEEKGWIPNKGFLLSGELRKLDSEGYNTYPDCEFVIYEGDMVFFFSDGLLEGRNKNGSSEIFGMKRLKNILVENCTLMPQVIINIIYDEIFDFIGDFKNQEDDMTGIIINFPRVRS